MHGLRLQTKGICEWDSQLLEQHIGTRDLHHHTVVKGVLTALWESTEDVKGSEETGS